MPTGTHLSDDQQAAIALHVHHHGLSAAANKFNINSDHASKIFKKAELSGILKNLLIVDF